MMMTYQTAQLSSRTATSVRPVAFNSVAPRAAHMQLRQQQRSNRAVVTVSAAVAAPAAPSAPAHLDATTKVGAAATSISAASTSQRSASSIVPFRRPAPAPEQSTTASEPSVWNITWDNWKPLTVDHLDEVYNLIQAELAVDQQRLLTSVDNSMFSREALHSRLAAGSLHGAFVDNGSKLCAIVTINFRPAGDAAIQDQFSVRNHDVVHTGWISRSGVSQDAVQMEDSVQLSQAVMSMSQQMPTLYLGTIINMKGSQNALTSMTTYVANTFADVDQMCWCFGSKLGNDRSRALFLRKVVRMMLMHRPEEQRVRIYGFGHTAPDAKRSPAVGFTMFKESTLQARAPWLLKAATAAEAADQSSGYLAPAVVA